MASLSLASGAVACLFIGTAVYTVGLGLPYWNSYSSNEYRGLWETCYYDYYCYSKVCFYNTYDRMHDDYLLAAQIVTSCGLGFGLIAFILGISWVGRPQMVSLIQATTAFSFMAGLIGTGGVAVYGAGYRSPDDFAYWLTVAGCAVYVIAGIVAAAGLCTPSKSAVAPLEEGGDKSHASEGSSDDCDANQEN